MQLQNAAGRLLKVGVGLYTGQGSTAGDAGYRETNALARVADEAGFDSFSVSEHHGGTTRTCRVRSCWLRLAPLTLCALPLMLPSWTSCPAVG